MNILCSDKVEVIQLKMEGEKNKESRISSLIAVHSIGESQRILLKIDKLHNKTLNKKWGVKSIKIL